MLLALLAMATAMASNGVSAVKACTDKPVPKATWAAERTLRIDTDSGVGTAVIISPDGFLLTAAHVIQGATEIKAVFADGRELAATVVRSVPKSDLALLRIDEKKLACIPVNAVPVEIGSDVLVIGSPGGSALTHSVSKGIVSGYREMDGVTVLQTDASINAGNSGGPVVGEAGDLVGIVSFKAQGVGVEGLGFAVAATNIPAELSIRWGTATDPALFEERDLSVTPEAMRAALVQIRYSEGVAALPNRTYTQEYRPSVGNIASGALIMTTGFVLPAVLSRQDPGEGAVYWGLSLGLISLPGALQMAFGFAPTGHAPIVVEGGP